MPALIIDSSILCCHCFEFLLVSQDIVFSIQRLTVLVALRSMRTIRVELG